MRRLILAAVLLAPSTAHAGKKYASFMIDRFDMTATLSEPVGLFSAPRAYFERTETASGARVEDRREGGCLGVFDFAAGGRLLHRARSLAVLEGPFGRVYARFDYWYPPERPRGAANTSARRDIPHREPERADAARGRVDSFALVRVLKDGKKFKIASADYGLDGSLRALRVDLSSSSWTGTEVAFSSSAVAAAAWGLPAKVDPKIYTEKPFAGAATQSPEVELEAALIYYSRGAFVERLIRRGSRIDRDWLAFSPSEVERALAKSEAGLPFEPGPGR